MEERSELLAPFSLGFGRDAVKGLGKC
jgi:hypothetical protein